MRKFKYTQILDNKEEKNHANSIKQLVKKSGKLDFLNENFQNQFQKLQAKTIVDEAYYSAKIEGMQLNYGRLAKMVENPAMFPAQNDFEKQALGNAIFVKALIQKLNSFEVDTTSLLAMFQVIFSINGANSKSLYRRYDKQKVFVDGKIEEVEVSPVEAFESPLYTGSAISALAESLNENLESNLINIAKLNVDLMCIRPFDSGAGRIIRIFTLLCLFKSKVDIFKYVSLSKMFETRISDYYENLNLCSENWMEGNNKYEPFIDYFLESINSAYDELFDKFEVSNKQNKSSASVTIKFKASNKNDLSKPEQIKKFFDDSDANKPFSKQDVAFNFPNISMSTIENTLAELVKQGTLTKVGNGKSTKYRSTN